jgi:hypothetical protein
MTTNEYRYILEKGSKKHHCPECEKRTFVRYIDTTTGEYLPDLYGRCDRETKCFNHVNPYKNGYAKMIWDKEKGQNTTDWKPQKMKTRPKAKVKIQSYFIPKEVLQQTLTIEGYEQNVFIKNLSSNVPFPFEDKDLEQVISMYYLGTICKGYRKGAVSFPFIDKDRNIRAIQVKQFDKNNHTTGTDFLHAMLDKQYKKKKEPLPQWLNNYQQNEIKVSCLFGEHLLNKYPSNPVALVEAPKSAIYGTLYFGFPEQPENLLWLAVYNLSSLNLNKCKSLKGRNVYLFPDLSENGKAFELWSSKATELENEMLGTRFVVSDLLEQHATDAQRIKGFDLADYLIKQNWRKFRTPLQEPIQEKASIPTPPKNEKGEKSEALEKTIFLKDELFQRIEAVKTKPLWDIEALESYFSSIDLPSHPIRLNQCSKIGNISKFISSHLTIIKANNGKRTFLPYFERLQELKTILSTFD